MGSEMCIRDSNVKLLLLKDVAIEGQEGPAVTLENIDQTGI